MPSGSRAARRLSPQVLIDLLDLTEPALSDYFRTLDPHAPARFGVAWAGEETSPNWFDIGREYTERWLHQQQIREAVGATPLTSRKWLHPTLDIFIRALPFTYREVEARRSGRSVRIEIQGEAGGTWTLKRTPEGWRLFTGGEASPATRVTLTRTSPGSCSPRAFTRIRPSKASGSRATGAWATAARRRWRSWQ